MTRRVLDKNLEDHDRFYAELLAVHNGLTAEQSAALNARLILVMANHVGDLETLRDMLAIAAGPSRGG